MIVNLGSKNVKQSDILECLKIYLQCQLIQLGWLLTIITNSAKCNYIFGIKHWSEIAGKSNLILEKNQE